MTGAHRVPRRLRREGGFSLIELLVAMVVVGILLAAVFGTFINFLSESSEQAALGKRGVDTRLGLELMRGDLSRIGFGIGQNDLAGTVNGSTSAITFRSTAVHSRGNEHGGVHSVLYKDGGLEAHDWLGTNLSGDTSGVVLTPDREKLAWDQLQDVSVSERNLFFVARSPSDPNYYYQRTYELSSGTSDQCASGAYNLQFDDADGGSESILDCVLDLRFSYGYRMADGTLSFQDSTASAPGGAEDEFPDVLKVGLIVQVGHEYRGQTPTSGTLNYRDPDLKLGTPIDPTGDAEHRRWKTVEWNVPLENMP